MDVVCKLTHGEDNIVGHILKVSSEAIRLGKLLVSSESLHQHNRVAEENPQPSSGSGEFKHTQVIKRYARKTQEKQINPEEVDEA